MRAFCRCFRRALERTPTAVDTPSSPGDCGLRASRRPPRTVDTRQPRAFVSTDDTSPIELMNLRDLKLRARDLFAPRRAERELDEEFASTSFLSIVAACACAALMPAARAGRGRIDRYGSWNEKAASVVRARVHLRGFLGVLAVQVAVFLTPLAMAPMGVMSGEMAGLIAIVLWFVLGTPLSYAVLDRVRSRRVRRLQVRVEQSHSFNSASFSGGPAN